MGRTEYAAQGIPPPPPPPTYPQKKRTNLKFVSIAVVLIIIIIIPVLFIFGVVPWPFFGEGLKYPETAWIAGLEDSQGNLVVNGQTTTEKVITVKGNVTNPQTALAAMSMLPSNAAEAELSGVRDANARDDVLAETGTFNGKVVLNFNGQESFLEVSDIPDESGGPDLWEFEGKLVLAQGENTFQIFVQDSTGTVVGQSKLVKVTANVPAMAITATLTWDTNSSDLDLHVWHFPWIQPGTAGGMDGEGGWWIWSGHWAGTPWQSEWIKDFSLSDFNDIEEYTWRNYSYTYKGQAYNYADGVGHCWYDDTLPNGTIDGIAGAQLDFDDRNGYGPEVFTMQDPRPGAYVIVVRMYDPHECNTTTNAVVKVKLFQQETKTFSHYFVLKSQIMNDDPDISDPSRTVMESGYTHGNDVVSYPTETWETHQTDFPQAWVTDWVAYTFYILPDNTVSATAESPSDITVGAECKVSASLGSKFVESWFLIDHPIKIRTDTPWPMNDVPSTGIFKLYRAWDSANYEVELIMRIDRGGVDVQPGGVYQGTDINIPPGLYYLGIGQHSEGTNKITVNMKCLVGQNAG
jgi:hypothetical protein